MYLLQTVGIRAYALQPAGTPRRMTKCSVLLLGAMAVVAIIGSVVGVISFGNKLHVCSQVAGTDSSIRMASRGSSSGRAAGPLQTSSALPIRASPSQIYLLGERNSGTNFVERILGRQIDKQHTRVPPLDLSILHVFGTSFTMSSDIPLFGLKHMFRHQPLNDTEVAFLQEATDLLWVLVVRNPCDWADAMYRTPWHLCPTKNDAPDRCPGEYIGTDRIAVKDKTRLEFFQDMEWRDWHESTLDPNDFTYDSVFELRRHKLSLMKQLMEVSPHRFHLAHLDQVELQPELFVQHFVKQFGLQVDPNATAVKAKHHKTLCLEEKEWEVAQRKIDWNMEAHFGFVPTDCHMCYS
jgi:hypothetical protein